MQNRLMRILFICTLILMMYDLAIAAEKISINQIGRYQLIQGKLTSTDGSGDYVSTDAMYKLDTVTGKLYLCYVFQSSKASESGNVTMTRTCNDFERVWETTPQPAKPAMK
ncbi:MAG: hypothetical protein WC156_12130 [Pedobacter sp.]